MSNLKHLESLRLVLINKTLRAIPNTLKVFLYKDYFDTILSYQNPLIKESYLNEFFPAYIESLSRFNITGLDPSAAVALLEQIKLLNASGISSEFYYQIEEQIHRIEEELDILNRILLGEEVPHHSLHKALFPLIINDSPPGLYGIIESVTVRVSKSASENKFIIIPSESEIEKAISVQCSRSWLSALSLAEKYIKHPFPYHEVIISFDRKEGFYQGESLGTALTISFLEQILKFYNPAYTISIKEKCAFTGGVDKEGRILCNGKEAVIRKTAAVFFSDVETFVLPKSEEKYAETELKRLQNDYPGRKVKLAGVNEIMDVINRRDIIDIRKQKLIVRSGKFIRRYWISAAAAVLMAAILSLLLLLDLDDNPFTAYYDANLIYIKNKNNKNLLIFDGSYAYTEAVLNKYIRLIDVDNDGNNEILFVETPRSSENNNVESGSLSCYDRKGNMLWNYSFDKTVSSPREKMVGEYGIQLVDTVTLNNKKMLIVVACNSPSYAAAAIKVDLIRGIQIGDEYWTSGFINDAIINDINNDGIVDFTGWGPDNGFEQPVLWSLPVDSLSGCRPSTSEYQFNDKAVPGLIFYIRIPKKDYDVYMKFRSGFPLMHGLNYNPFDKILRFYSGINHETIAASIMYRMNTETFEIQSFSGDEYRLLRDSLVTRKVLSGPFTDTREYLEEHTSKILFWKNGVWLTRKELLNEG